MDDLPLSSNVCSMPSTRGAITLPPRCTLALGLLLCSVFFFNFSFNRVLLCSPRWPRTQNSIARTKEIHLPLPLEG